MKYLHIGGVADGQWIEVLQLSPLHIVFKPLLKTPEDYNPANGVLSIEPEKEHYELESLAVGRNMQVAKVFRFFRLRDMSPEEAYERLLKGYRSQNEEVEA